MQPELPGPVHGLWKPIGRMVSPKQGAFGDYIEPLPHLFVSNSSVPEFILVINADAVLDNHLLKRVIYENSRLNYKGGDLILKDVYFANCAFEIAQTPMGAKFMTTLLESPSVSFVSNPKYPNFLPH
jgi:hypothetical protein